MPQAGFEPAILAGERLQTHALDRSATAISDILTLLLHKTQLLCSQTFHFVVQKTLSLFILH